MLKEIQYSGLSVVPDDYQSPDGQLTTALNLIPEDNQLRPLFPPSVVCSLPDECTFVHIHKTSVFTHFIILDATNLRVSYLDKQNAIGIISSNSLSRIHTFSASTTIHQVNSIGNTLVVLTDEGVFYFLWKDGSYISLGNHIPELPISFGLQGTPRSTSQFNVGDFTSANLLNVPDASTPKVILPYEAGNTSLDAAINTMTDVILAKVNKFIREEATDKGKFIMPFFVCYAFRLYDGSLTMRSAPVLMIPNSGTAPQVIISSSTTTGSTTQNRYISLSAKVGAVVCDLDYACIDPAALAALKNWGDIVKSVDIFISAPIYTYDQSEGKRIQGFEYSEDFSEYTISFVKRPSEFLTVNNGTVSGGSFDICFYRKAAVAPLVFMQYSTSDAPHTRFILPTRDEKDVFNDIRDCCNFYLLKSIELDDIDCKDYSSSTTVLLPSRPTNANDRDPKSPRTVIEVEEGFLEALVTKEDIEMAKETTSHDIIAASFSYSYNQRLNLANVNKLVSMPFNPTTFLPFCQPKTQNSAFVLSDDTSSATIGIDPDTTSIFLKTKQDSKEIISQSPSCHTIGIGTPFVFFYYPDLYADTATLVMETPDTSQGVTLVNGEYHYLSTLKNVITLPLKKHDNLNGAYFFDGWEPTPSQTGWLTPSNIPSSSIPTTSADNTIPQPNKLYTSEINNPFLFPYINTVGTGSILGISSAAKALSQGQFGQFPLYAFCSDGVWALEVAASGIFSARQPITRDVCISSDSITQLDSAVLFAADRGIMLIQGSDSICITDPTATDTPFDVLARLPKLSQLTADFGWQGNAPFRSYLDGCRMLYDYIHQRIILYNPSLDEHRTVTGQIKHGGGIIGYENGVPIYGVVWYEDVYSYSYTRRFAYAYVYSLKSKQWGMMISNLASSLNSYPDALAMDSNNNLVSFSQPLSAGATVKSLLITRPLKLDAPDTLKSIHTLIQRGLFQRGDVQTVLYGSRDLYSWHLIGSSTTEAIRSLRGSPYKYFRIVALSTLADGKSLSGATLDIQSRHTNLLL